MLIAIIDTETTGFSHEHDRVCEVAAVILKDDSVVGSDHTFVDPGRDIPVTASAVHHITIDHVKGAPTLKDAVAGLKLDKVDYIVAHNADFDKGFLPMLRDKTWICTYKCAQKLIPDAPSYSNQALRYFLKLDIPEADGRAGQPHSALFDACVTGQLLLHLMSLAHIEELARISEEPVLLKKMPFGKHRGAAFADIPKDYLQWLKGRDNLDPNLKHTLDQHCD